MRPLRCPLPRGLYELCTRITGNALLARPSEEVNAMILGVIGRAQLHAEIKLHAFIFLSNHYHILVSIPNGPELSKFMQFVNGNIAKELNLINERDGALWERRFRSIPVAQDSCTQVWRLRYLLAHGTKENLVGRIGDWPGASSLKWLRDGKPIIGRWLDRTARYHARRRKGYVEQPDEFAIYYELKMTVLPCWRDLPAAAWRSLVRNIIGELQAEANERIEATGLRPLGVAAVLAADPYSRVRSKHGRAPTVLSRDRGVGREMVVQLRALAELWREAADAAMALMTGGNAASLPLPSTMWLGLRV